MKEAYLLIKLNPVFQKRLFENIIKIYGSSLKASKILIIPASSIRACKSLYFKSLSFNLIKKLIEMNLTTSAEVKKNTLARLDRREQVRESMFIGRKIRHDKITSLKKSIPHPKEIISNNCLNLEPWLDKYLPLANLNIRNIIVEDEGTFFSLKYKNFTKEGFKVFEKKLPKIIKLDDEFMYYFGLWCGDRSGGKRFGIANQNQDLIKFTEKFLIKHYQKVEKALYITKGLDIPNVSYDKIFFLNHDAKGWALSIYSINGVLSSFFYYLQSYLEFFLQKYNPHAFFAGLFDAEGNVSLHNKSLRFACQNKKLINTYSKYLKKIDLYERYDGGCLITYNCSIFYDNIMPLMKHKEKINLLNIMVKGKGKLPQDYLSVLNYIRKNPNRTNNDISKGLKKNKVYPELKLLSDFSFISRKGYPNLFEITEKGLSSLGA